LSSAHAAPAAATINPRTTPPVRSAARLELPRIVTVSRWSKRFRAACSLKIRAGFAALHNPADSSEQWSAIADGGA